MIKLSRTTVFASGTMCSGCGRPAYDHPYTQEDSLNGVVCNKALVPEANIGEAYIFHCVGCDGPHSFRTKIAKGEEKRPDGSNTPIWGFNGNMECPTFTPSLLCRISLDPPRICHLNLTSGKLCYHSDCTHPLAGKTVDMVDL